MLQPQRWPRLTLPNVGTTRVRVLYADIVSDRDRRDPILRLKCSTEAFGEGAVFFEWEHVKRGLIERGLVDPAKVPAFTRDTWDHTAQIAVPLSTPHLDIVTTCSAAGVVTTSIRPAKPSNLSAHGYEVAAVELAAAIDTAVSKLSPVYKKHDLLLGPAEALEAGRAVLARSARR